MSRRLLPPFLRMSRRDISASPVPQGERAPKRQKLGDLTPESFKNGVFLAPMVRSGACTPAQLPPQRRSLNHSSTHPFDRPQTRRVPRLGPRNRRQGHTAHGTRRRPYVLYPRPVLPLTPVQRTPASSPTTARRAPSSPPIRSKNPISYTKSAPHPPNSPSKQPRPSHRTSQVLISTAVVRNRSVPIRAWARRCSPIQTSCAPF